MSKELHKEKVSSLWTTSTVEVKENEIVGFNKSNTLSYSFRIYKDDLCGYYY